MTANPETCTRLRLFWAWDAPKEEEWLEQMARDGWLLTQGGIRFHFVRATPAECRYRLDYRTESGPALNEYLNLCKDAGWQHVCRFTNWHYFRCSDPSAPELHSDPASLAASYKRLLAFLVIVLALNLLLFSQHLSPATSRFGPLYEALEWFRFALIVILAYGIFRIAAFIRQLQAAAQRRLL